MAPHNLIAPEACFSGIRAELNAGKANTDHASRVPKHCLEQNNELLTKDKLRQDCILKEVYRKHFPNVPLALPSCRLPNEIRCNAHPKRALVNIVVTRPSKARDFERHATHRGCSFHSPELIAWSELCHVPTAEQAVLPWANILF